ncbi:hypothetical protein IEQ34_021345 [Dendrobium chrysotoxum]|uniref:Uncharacterized protein n=1 Tax=Dendrobium chrysotoxum TaxID=161865 RepID=A0AAV7G4R8_DENCH|nr:hypothetical protein IEQ34_021345 [Dendrobium chrysotoxum]
MGDCSRDFCRDTGMGRQMAEIRVDAFESFAEMEQAEDVKEEKSERSTEDMSGIFSVRSELGNRFDKGSNECRVDDVYSNLKVEKDYVYSSQWRKYSRVFIQVRRKRMRFIAIMLMTLDSVFGKNIIVIGLFRRMVFCATNLRMPSSREWGMSTSGSSVWMGTGSSRTGEIWIWDCLRGVEVFGELEEMGRFWWSFLGDMVGAFLGE